VKTDNTDELEGAALAAAVAERVMGWHQHPHPMYAEWWVDAAGKMLYTFGAWRPDRDMNQAFQVMRAKAEWCWRIEEWQNGIVQAWIEAPIDANEYGVIAVVRVLAIDGDRTRAWRTAILRAALKAVEVG